MKSKGGEDLPTSRTVWALEALREWLFSAGFWTWMVRIVGIACIAGWAAMIWGRAEKDYAQDGPLGGFATGLFGFAFLVAGTILLVPSLVPWVASPLLRFVDSIYLGSHNVEPPPLTYEVAERRIREGRWQDAATEFERIAYWHPGEERAWREAVRCAELAGDTEGAAWLKRRARLRCPRLRFDP